MAEKTEIKWGIIGYGGAFNMGKAHAGWINASPGMKTSAVCDMDPKRTAKAKEELPGVETYTDVTEMLKNKDIDCAVIILPHNLHHPVAMECWRPARACAWRSRCASPPTRQPI